MIIKKETFKRAWAKSWENKKGFSLFIDGRNRNHIEVVEHGKFHYCRWIDTKTGETLCYSRLSERWFNIAFSKSYMEKFF